MASLNFGWPVSNLRKGEQIKYIAIIVSTQGITKPSTAGSTNWMMIVPTADPINAVSIKPRKAGQSSLPRLNNKVLEVATPTQACNLLVPNAIRGGTPDNTRAGIVIKPPPPAKVSRKPAQIATINSKSKISVENSKMTPVAKAEER